MKRIHLISILMLCSFGSLFSQVRDIQAEELSSYLPKMTKPIVIDIWAEWCGPCKRYAPVFYEVSRSYNAYADFYRINLDNNKEFCNSLGIEAIPTTIIIYDQEGHYLSNTGILTASELKNGIKEAWEKVKYNYK